MADQQRGIYLGIGVGTYQGGRRSLDYAISDVVNMRDLIGDDFAGDPLIDPTTAQVNDLLESLPGSADGGGPAVLVWSGHGNAHGGDLRLLTTNSGNDPSAGMPSSEIALKIAASGASQILLIIDACFAGEAAVPATKAAVAMMQASPPDDRHVWVGVLASCQNAETARDGLFGQHLLRLLRDGPTTPELRVRWSAHSKRISGHDLCQAVLKEWTSDVQQPAFLAAGSTWFMLPNPLYRPRSAEHVVEHLLRAARGGAGQDEPSWFTGRTTEVTTVAGWVRSRAPGAYVVTGSAGTGKSAIVGRVVSLSNRTERDRLLAGGQPLKHADPGLGSVHAHVHARGLTADRMAEVLAGQLVIAGVWTPEANSRTNASLLIGRVQQAAEDTRHESLPPTRPVVIVVDGLDEARGEALTIGEELLVRLARHAVVIVSTRDLPGEDTKPSLVELLARDRHLLDLDDPALLESARTDVRTYVENRLIGASPTMDVTAVADLLAGRASMIEDRPFLLARIVADQLRARPVDTSRPGWQSRVSTSMDEAFATDLAGADSPRHRELPPGLEPAALARHLLSALTWAFGAGFPEEEWITAANALLPGIGLGPDDVAWLLNQLGRYMVQDGEAGAAVYRIAHQSLADSLRPTNEVTAQTPFGPNAERVALALLERYRSLLAGGVPAIEPGYLWRYAWRHAGAAGPATLAALRDLASIDTNLDADVASASLDTADTLQFWGNHAEALPPTEEAVALYRELAATNPAFLPNLASALNNLGNCYSGLGRREDALAPTEEAIALYRELAATNPHTSPDLAGALNNLGIRYGELGRREDALPPTEEAAALHRELAATNPAHLPDLAGALNNLGVRYGELGRREDALPPTEEAVALHRELAATNPAHLPDLAGALNNLGVRYSELGRREDALPPTEEAVALHRELAATNPTHLPDLASALNNLGNRYSELGRREDALPPTEEAIALHRELAATNPAYLPDLAGSLNNLGVRFSGLGRREDALPPTEEAVALYRELAATNAAFLPDLAGALNNLGVYYSGLRRREDALPPTEEAVALYRELAATNPAFLPDLAGALNNLGVRYSELGRREDALPPTEDAVALYRELAATNPAFLPDLAMALNNLGNRYSELGRREDALTPTEEAVALYRELAATNPAFLPNLASALNNLGVYYSGLRRREDALTPAEEAVALRRELAATNPAFLSDLAGALNNLGVRYGELGRREDALPPTGEAVALYRELAATNAAFLPDLAMALNNLGVYYSGLRRREDALPPTEEAVALYRELAATNAAILPDLARALNNLGNRYGEIGDGPAGETAWESVLGGLPQYAAFMLTSRAAAASPGDPRAAGWLGRALSLTTDRSLVAELRDHGRRHRHVNPADFDVAWERDVGGPVPTWLGIDPSLLASARAWVATATYDEEGAYLAAHPQLLDPAADDAVAETLLSTSDEDAQWYRGLREEARRTDAHVAYRPLLLGVLAMDFARSDVARQRIMLAERGGDLLTDEVRDTLARLESRDAAEGADALRASAFVDLARLDAHEGVMETLQADGDLGLLMQQLATSDDAAALGPTAVVAFTTAADQPRAAVALFYLSVASAIGGGLHSAGNLASQARAAGPDQIHTWLGRCAAIGQVHTSVLPLLAVLTQPSTSDDERQDG